MSTHATGGIGPQPDFTLGVQQSGGELDINVEEAQRQNEADIQVDNGRLLPASEITTHFPDSDHADGNTLRCLEQALLDETGQGNLTGAARDEALTNIKQGITGIRGSLLKENNRADSSIVADTHTDPTTGEKYYKFLTTWEIDVNIDGEPKTIRKSQWTVTGVKQLRDYSDPEQIRLQQHRAILAVKCHRHLHKAALNPQHRDYTYVRDCIDDLRRTNIVGKEGYTDQNRMMFSGQTLHLTAKGDDRSMQLEESITQKEAAASLGIRLFNSSGKKVHIYIDQSQEGRKINEAGNKYLKKGLDMENPDQSFTPLANKRKEQGDLMITRGNKEFSTFMKALHATPDEMDTLLEGSRFEGTNERGLTFEQVKSELFTARKSQEKIYKRNAKFAGKKLVNTLLQTYTEKLEKKEMGGLEQFGKQIMILARHLFTSEKSFTKYLAKKLQKDELSEKDRERIEDAVKELRKDNNTLRASEQSNARLKKDSLIAGVNSNRHLSQELKDLAKAHIELTMPDNPEPSKLHRDNNYMIDLASPLGLS